MASVSGTDLSSSLHPASESLHAALDKLWTRYLSLLDQYQSLRQELAIDIASGHFDLSKANFSNPHRIRYGRDFYDERMQASTRVSYDSERLFTLTSFPRTDEGSSNEESQSKSEGNDTEKSTASADNSIDEAENSKEEFNTKDPLFWFGVLAPSPLRNSQSAFKNAVGKIVKVATVDHEMKAMEIEIRRMRKKLKKAAE